MHTPIEFYQKNLKFNDKFIEELYERLDEDDVIYNANGVRIKKGMPTTFLPLMRYLEEKDNLKIIIHTSGGAHPEGRYSIPKAVLFDFILSKVELPCWKNYGFWTQTKVPAEIQEYFTAKENQ